MGSIEEADGGGSEHGHVSPASNVQPLRPCRMAAAASIGVGVMSAMMVLLLTTWESAVDEDHAIGARSSNEPEDHAIGARSSNEPEVDPRFWQTINKWRDEQQEQGKTRRLMHNSALGTEAPRHSSIHYFYQPSAGATEGIQAWYNEVQITSRDEDSFYCVNGHAYGYAGIQSVDMATVDGVRQMSKGKVLFSIWDQLCTGDDLDACPEDKRVQILECCDECECERFGGEGTGGKSGWYYNTWTMNTPYSFLTMTEPQPGNQVKFRGYFYAPELGVWKILGTFLVNRGPKDWAYQGQFSFVEQWSHKNPEALRWAKFGPVFARRGAFSTDLWDPVYQARWFHGTVSTEDQTHIESKLLTTGDGWEMGIGAAVVKTAMKNDIMTQPSPSTSCPWQLIAFVGNESAGSIPTALPWVPIPKVSCGGAEAEWSCGNCTQGHGAGWCNGDCSWRVDSGANDENGHCELTVAGRLLEGRQLASPAQISNAICHGGGTGTTTPHPPGYVGTNRYEVVVHLTVANVNYATLTADAALTSSFLTAAKAAVVAKAGTGVTTSHVNVTLSAGSVKVKATVTPPGTRNYTDVQYVLQTALSSALPTEMKTKLDAVSGLSALVTGTISVTGVNCSALAVSMNMRTDAKMFFFLVNHASKPMSSWVLVILLYGLLLRLGGGPAV